MHVPTLRPALTRLVAVGAFALVIAACGGGSSSPEATQTPSPQASTPAATTAPSRTPSVNAQGVRYCDYVPGESKPATMPDEVLNPPSPTASPTATAPPQTSVSADTTQTQMGVFSALRQAVIDRYVYTDYNGHDWDAITARHQALISAGLSDDGFAAAMQSMISELGDNHSYYQSPAEVAEDEQTSSQGQNFVGIGILASPIAGHPMTGAIIAVFPGSSAEEAGLRTHDLLLEVDGLPYRDEKGVVRSLGPAGTTFELTYQRPGEAEQKITMTRRAVSGFLPVTYCLVPDTRIGYILLPTFLDDSIDDQVRAALQKMTADGPLDGLVIDNRMNGGGKGTVAEATLAFFTSGYQGRSVGRTDERRIDLTAEDIGGSQTVPVVVLVGPETVSYGEIFTGVLQLSGRATVVGARTQGNVETLTSSNFSDGSRAWLATEAFEPVGLTPGAWEGVGITPDISAPSRWDLFTEATDPALAKAVDRLR